MTNSITNNYVSKLWTWHQNYCLLTPRTWNRKRLSGSQVKSSYLKSNSTWKAGARKANNFVVTNLVAIMSLLNALVYWLLFALSVFFHEITAPACAFVASYRITTSSIFITRVFLSLTLVDVLAEVISHSISFCTFAMSRTNCIYTNRIARTKKSRGAFINIFTLPVFQKIAGFALTLKTANSIDANCIFQNVITVIFISLSEGAFVHVIAVKTVAEKTWIALAIEAVFRILSEKYSIKAKENSFTYAFCILITSMRSQKTFIHSIALAISILQHKTWIITCSYENRCYSADPWHFSTLSSFFLDFSFAEKRARIELWSKRYLETTKWFCFEVHNNLSIFKAGLKIESERP